MPVFLWRVQGRDAERRGSAAEYFVDETWPIEADCLPEALIAAATNEIWDTGLDLDSEIVLTITPIEGPTTK